MALSIYEVDLGYIETARRATPVRVMWYTVRADGEKIPGGAVRIGEFFDDGSVRNLGDAIVPACLVPYLRAVDGQLGEDAQSHVACTPTLEGKIKPFWVTAYRLETVARICAHNGFKIPEEKEPEMIHGQGMVSKTLPTDSRLRGEMAHIARERLYIPYDEAYDTLVPLGDGWAVHPYRARPEEVQV